MSCCSATGGGWVQSEAMRFATPTSERMPGWALEIQGTELVEVGGYLDPAGNNFWGVEVYERDGRTIILGSDRDSGLWIFEDTSS